jgi:O-glycosyl hydrolase
MIGINKMGLTSSTNIEGVAALTPSGQKVVVLNNRDESATYQISIINKQGGVINLSLEPKSFTTIVYSD